jgi:hypothetical protein
LQQKVYKGLINIKNQEKWFDIVLLLILGGIVVSFDPPLRGCLLVLAMIAGAGDRKSMIDIPISIRYNTKPLYPGLLV